MAQRGCRLVGCSWLLILFCHGSAEEQAGTRASEPASSTRNGAYFLQQALDRNDSAASNLNVPARATSSRGDCSDYGAVYMDKDVAGATLQQRDGLPGDCCDFCDQLPNCNGWTWSAGTCSMKDRITGMVDRDGSLSLLKEGTCSNYGSIAQDASLDGAVLLEQFSLSTARCCYLCDMMPNCHGWAFHDTTCVLKSNAGNTVPMQGWQACIKTSAPPPTKPAPSPPPAPVTPPPRPQPPTQPPPTGCEPYSDPQGDQDIAGTLLSTLRVQFGSESSCCPLCTLTDGCDGYSYYQGVCYLKSDIKGWFSNPGRVSRVKSATYSCEGYQGVLYDTDIAGDMLLQQFGLNIGFCCNLCRAKIGCQAFVYFGSTCYLKTNVRGTFFSSGRTTRIKG